jgi:hypothetical protein
MPRRTGPCRYLPPVPDTGRVPSGSRDDRCVPGQLPQQARPSPGPFPVPDTGWIPSGSPSGRCSPGKLSHRTRPYTGPNSWGPAPAGLLFPKDGRGACPGMRTPCRAGRCRGDPGPMTCSPRPESRFLANVSRPHRPFDALPCPFRRVRWIEGRVPAPYPRPRLLPARPHCGEPVYPAATGFRRLPAARGLRPTGGLCFGDILRWRTLKNPSRRDQPATD